MDQIDIQLGYIKDDDDDRIDYFNNLPPARKLQIVEDFIKPRTIRSIDIRDEEEAKDLKRISKLLKTKEWARQPSVLYDEDMDEQKCEVERIKKLDPTDRDHQKFSAEAAKHQLHKPGKGREFAYMWLGRLFPPRVLKRFEDKCNTPTSMYRSEIMLIREELGRLLQNMRWDDVLTDTEKRELEAK